MRMMTVVVAALALVGLSTSAIAQPMFEKCKQQQDNIDAMTRDAQSMVDRMRAIDQQVADMTRQISELRTEKITKGRQHAQLKRRIAQQQAMHSRRCRGMKQCADLEAKVENLKGRMEPLSNTLGNIREGIRTRRAEIGTLSADIRRMENQFAQLGCDNLQIGQTEQSTFDKCSQLSKDWNNVQNRNNQLQAAIERLRNSYQAVMTKLRALGTELARLSAEMRKSCSHSHRLAEIDAMEQQQKDSRAMQGDLDEMDNNVKKFKMMKLIKTKPSGPDKAKDDNKDKRRRRTLKKAP